MKHIHRVAHSPFPLPTYVLNTDIGTKPGEYTGALLGDVGGMGLFTRTGGGYHCIGGMDWHGVL